jgi:catechol 2,3-dioxygenase-like lactoylglutathione lyase family enzyme
MTARGLRFVYAGIEVRDLRRSLRFYEGLGFRIRGRGIMEHGGEWVQLRIPRQQTRLELNYYPRGSRFHRTYRSGSELDHLGFRVADADAWARTAVRLGGKLVDRVDEPFEWLVYVTDPDGVWLEFIGDLAVRARHRRRRRAKR